MSPCGEHSALKTKFSLMQNSENVFQVLLIGTICTILLTSAENIMRVQELELFESNTRVWGWLCYRGGSIQFLGTKRHHDKWLQLTEDYAVRGCFAMSELGHGSNVFFYCPNCIYVISPAVSRFLYIDFGFQSLTFTKNY